MIVLLAVVQPDNTVKAIYYSNNKCALRVIAAYFISKKTT